MTGVLRAPKSTRLLFSVPTTADSRFILKLMNQPDYHTFIGDRGLKTIADAELYIREKLAPSFMKHGYGLWLVSRKSDKKPVGFGGLVSRDQFDTPDLGYAISHDHQGKGYASEAARAVLDFTTTHLGLDRVLAIVSPENVKSARVLQKVGFRRIRQQRLETSGHIVDVYDRLG